MRSFLPLCVPCAETNRWKKIGVRFYLNAGSDNSSSGLPFSSPGQIQKQLASHLPRWISYRLGTTENILNLFFATDRKYILYIQYDRAGAPSLCAASREIPEQLNQALWLKNIPAILTSGTLMAGGSFDRPQKIMGLSENQRVENFIAASPFNYEENCLLYIPDSPLNVQIGSEKEVEYLAEQICRLVEAAHGHTLVLFTSYALMGAVYNRSKIACLFL